MEKEILYMELGYYHPTNTNWSYRVYVIIDETGARLYSEKFGGDYRMSEKLKEKGFQVKKLFVGRGSSVEYKWRDIKDLKDIESYNGKNWGEDD